MPNSPPSPFADAAVAYAQRGWRVFKIPPGQKIPRDRWVNGGEAEAATSDVEKTAMRAAVSPTSNIGIATGRGLAVLDVDPQHGGKVPSWAPPTLCARTPNGGVHLYYAINTAEVRSSQGVLGPGLDVRGSGGMVLAPPSVTGDGAYEWVDPEQRVELIMPSLLDPAPAAAPSKPLVRASFGEGERHAAMVSLAGTMRGRGCEEPEIQAALRALNDTRFKPPLAYEWVDKIARDIVARYAPDDDLLP